MPDLFSFFPDGLAKSLAIFAQLSWVLQIALIIHVYRTGRPYWWIWILLMAPFIGGLAYVFIELLPGFKNPQGLIESLKPKKWKIAALRKDLDESDTVEKRINLAEALFEAGKVQEAHDLAVECLTGVFKNDPRTLVDVARLKLALKQHREALTLLESVDTTANRMLAISVQVAKGDALVGLERHAEAEAAYLNVAGKHIGEAPRAGLASVYEHTGRHAEAVAVWKDIRSKFRKGNPAWRRAERKWYKLATLKLKAANAA
jgi:hypothetical protein